MAIATHNAASTRDAPQLAAINGMRFLAVLHIYLYHLDGSDYASADIFPRWLEDFIEHGYVSTSFFFLLSGFILAYLYWAPGGGLAVSHRRFWWQRFTRIYPVHLIALLVTMAIDLSVWRSSHDAPTTGIAVASALATASLTQAWFPPLVPVWSWPTWALSALVFLYLVMPLLMRVLSRLSRAQAIGLLVVMPLISLLPTLVFLHFFPDGAPHRRNWQTLLGSTPIFWAPHFVAGMLMSRIFAISRFEQAWRERPRPWISFGDLALLAIVTLCVGAPETLPWRHILRHGALMPMYLFVLHDLAMGRGLAARVLSIKPLRFLGETSFSIFIWQNSFMALASVVFLAMPISKLEAFWVAVIGLLLVAIVSTYCIEKPIARWLRSRSHPQPVAAETFS